MRTINTEFYGDDSRWFIGVVAQIGDIRNLGRVRVRIFGIHNENTTKVKPSDLPWASVVVPVTQGGVSGSTMPDGIQVGAQVYGIFLDGKHSQSPLILGSIPHDSGLRVINDEPIDNFAVPQSSGSAPNFLAGDTVNEETSKALQESGVDPVPDIGAFISADMAKVLNKNTAGSGTLNIKLIGSNRQEQAFNYLKSYFETKGNISDPGSCAAAFVGNFVCEAGAALDPTIEPKSGEPAIGIAQWNDRQPDLKLFANNIPGASYKNFSVQLAFVVHELENKQKSRTYSRLVASTTMLEYAEVVMALYETPQTVVDYHNESNFLINYITYHMSRGGIRSVASKAISKGTDTNAMRKYLQDFEKRLAACKAISTTYGDS